MFPTHLTYRAIGSSSGMHEFVGSDNGNVPQNHFGSGDIPMSSSNFAALQFKMVHIPFAVGAIGIFHSVPAAENGGDDVKLDSCLLAKIFSRQIKTWDHADIKAANPKLSVPAGTNIKVAHRTEGSSSTAGTTQYLKKACGDSWSLETGSSIDWPEDTFSVQGSGGMAAYIRENTYAIGYLDAGHGHREGFGEIALENKDGQSQTTKQADIGAAATVALQTPGAIPDDPSADWSGVNLYDMSGATSWPITLFSYLYVQQDLRAMDSMTATLLKAFLEFVASERGQTLMQTYGFVPVPSAVKNKNAETMTTIMFPEGTMDMVFEIDTMRGAGMEENVISAKRRSYGDVERETLMADFEVAKVAAEARPTVTTTMTTTMTGVVTDNDDSEGGDDDDDDDDGASGVAWASLIVGVLAALVSGLAIVKSNTPTGAG
mmetsp:Transcript_30395/g.72874  ORF Transcript_30395/g.72874 Transcript_30395/m.72874 type:complete len:432 (-) Transcript_30395:98-1393(-)